MRNPLFRTNLAERHILATANTLLNRLQESEPKPCLRVLDIGCGDARLLCQLQSGLAQTFPDVDIELFGFDVSDQAYNTQGLMTDALARLCAADPNTDWQRRLRVWPANQDWDFPDGHFDLAISNQVLEHVQDLEHFLGNLKRCLRVGGQAVHLFPLKNHLVEAHTHMPMVHYIRDFETRVAYATLLTRLGLSRRKKDEAILGVQSPSLLARDACQFVQSCTFYRSFRELAKKANEHQLTISHAFTKQLYLQKLRQLFRAQTLESYPQRASLFSAIAFPFFSYLSSVTLTMESVQYDVTQRIAREKQYDRERRTGAKLAA